MTIPYSWTQAAGQAYLANAFNATIKERFEAALAAALPFICEDIARQIDLTPSQCKDGDYSEGYLDAMVACTLLVRRYPGPTPMPPGLWHDSASSATGPDSTAVAAQRRIADQARRIT